MTFALVQNLTPAIVDIKNLSSSKLTLLAVIENPLGDTRILNTRGDIIAGRNALVQSNTLGNASAPVLPEDFLGVPDGQFNGPVVFGRVVVPGVVEYSTVTRADGGSWAALAFHAGDLIKIAAGAATPRVYQIGPITGANNSVLRLTTLAPFPTGTVTAGIIRFHGIEATRGTIGGLGAFLPIELIVSAGLPEQLFADAGSDLFLNLTTRLRDDLAAGATLPVNVGFVGAGGEAFVRLRQTVHEDGTGSGPGAVLVRVPSERAFGSNFQPFHTFFRPDSGTGAPFSRGAFGQNPTVINSTYNFGLIQAGGNIDVDAVLTDTTHLLGITATTDLRGTNDFINASTNGNIALTEAVPGAMRVATIESTRGNVDLTVPDLPRVGQDLSVLDSGQVSAFGTVTITAGGNVELPANSQLHAGEQR
jgi:hypothetical protein